MRLQFINQVDNPKFCSTTRLFFAIWHSIILQPLCTYIATFVRSLQCRSLCPAILNAEFSEIETKSTKNYGMLGGDMTSAKRLCHSFPQTLFPGSSPSRSLERERDPGKRWSHVSQPKKIPQRGSLFLEGL